MQVQDDIYYIKKVLHGDIHAYSFLVERYKKMTYTLALKITSVPEDAEEVAQDAFVKAFHSLADFKGESKFSTWLYKIVYHQAISRMRKKHVPTFSIDDDHFRTFDVHDDDHFLTKLSDEEQNVIVRSAIDRLPADERALITLFYLNECSVKEITGITDDSESNIKVKLFRARKKLAEILKHTLNHQIITDHAK